MSRMFRKAAHLFLEINLSMQMVAKKPVDNAEKIGNMRDRRSVGKVVRNQKEWLWDLYVD